MADSDGQWTFEDGYTLINMISGDCHHAKLRDFERLVILFEQSRAGMDIITFTDVFGVRIALRNDRIESVECKTSESIDEITRVNAHAQAREQESNPTWMEN